MSIIPNEWDPKITPDIPDYEIYEDEEEDTFKLSWIQRRKVKRYFNKLKKQGII